MSRKEHPLPRPPLRAAAPFTAAVSLLIPQVLHQSKLHHAGQARASKGHTLWHSIGLYTRLVG
eukprot:1144271-Pelagomonas_calceolata.AAC.1